MRFVWKRNIRKTLELRETETGGRDRLDVPDEGFRVEHVERGVATPPREERRHRAEALGGETPSGRRFRLARSGGAARRVVVVVAVAIVVAARASPELLRADVQPLQHGDECVAGRLSGVGESAQRGARDGFRFRRPREIRDTHRSGDEVVSDRLKRASRALGRHFERLFVRLVGKRVGDVSRVIVQQRARGVEERVQGRRRVFRVFERDVERSTQSVHSLSLFREITGATARLTPRVVLRHRLGYRRHAPRRKTRSARLLVCGDPSQMLRFFVVVLFFSRKILFR